MTHTTIAILLFKGAAFVSPLQSMMQDDAETNAILNDNDVTLDNHTERTPQEVAKLLWVDAIVTGTVQAR